MSVDCRTISKPRSKSSGPLGGRDMRRAPSAAAEVQQVATDVAEQLGMVAILINNARPFTDNPFPSMEERSGMRYWL